MIDHNTAISTRRIVAAECFPSGIFSFGLGWVGLLDARPAQTIIHSCVDHGVRSRRWRRYCNAGTDPAVSRLIITRCGCDNIIESNRGQLWYDQDDLREMNCGNNWSERTMS